MEINLKVTDEMVHTIIQSELRDSIRYLRQDIKNLESKEELKPHQQEDLRDNKRYLSACEEVLRYYTPHSEWAGFGI